MKVGITVSDCTNEYHKASQCWGLSCAAATDRPSLDSASCRRVQSVPHKPQGKIPAEGDPLEILECADPASGGREPEEPEALPGT